MKINVYIGTSDCYHKILYAFAKGAGKYDTVKIITKYKYEPSDVAVILWSPKIVPNHPETNFRKEVFFNQQALGKDTVIIEQPLIRNINNMPFQVRIGLNDVSRLGEFGNYYCSSDRWNRLNKKIEAWKNGESIVIIGQLHGDYSLGEININTWVEDTINKLKKETQRPIYFKPHPKATLQYPTGDTPIINDINWNDIWATVTYSSGMCIDSLINGVPCITTSERSFAWDITSHDLCNVENVSYDDREQWLWNLAYAQWAENEVADGEPWKRLREYVK